MLLQRSQHILLFGDQTVEKLSSIQKLVRCSKTSPAAKRFLQEATDIVQLEFARISKEEHGWTQTFDTLLGLAEDNAGRDNANGMVATVLMCIGRLGALIVATEQDPTILGSKEEPVQVLGFCTGLLPAAAMIVAKDSSELHYLSREIISITFRMAFELKKRMVLIENAHGSWARTYTGLSVEKTQKILDEFHDGQNIPTVRRISIGVVSEGWLTLVGVPSSLARLSSWSTEIANASQVKTNAEGLIHSTNTPPINIDAVLGDSPIKGIILDWSKVRMMSPVSCKQYDNTTLGSLLGEIVDDVAHHVLHVGATIDKFSSQLDSTTNFKMAVVGPTGLLPAVEHALKNKCISYRIIDHTSTTASSANARGGSGLVAIIGMAGRFPGSETIEGFWEGLQAGKCHIKKIPKNRFDLDDFYDPTGEKKNSTTAQHGAWLDNPGLFDHRLFNVSPREAAQMDPIQRLCLTTSYEALESAGYHPNGTLATESNRIATYFGQTSDDWHEILNNEGIDIYYVPSLVRAFCPSRLNYHYKWGGGSFAVDSACATSTTAVSLACSALLARECDTALAGGGSVLVSPNAFSGLSRSGMISNTGGCRTYHDDADGYARGEGVAMVVLKRLEDAEADNDNILGVIRGFARTYSSTSTSITHPSHVSQERIYNDVVRQSALDPEEISYVEMHGTGTQAGDFEEMMSVTNVMARHRSKDNPLTVGAVKAAVGHGEAVAGVTSLIKVLMMLRDHVVPPQPGWPFKLNRHFPQLDKMNVKIATKTSELRSSRKGDGKIKILLNCFDASGGNTALAIEEAPAMPAKADDPRTAHVVTVSARSIASLQKNRENLLEYLTRNPDTKLADLAYTTAARRMHEILRVAYVGKSTRDITRQLREDISSGGVRDPRAKLKNTTRVFLFTGQGSQYAGMGIDLFRANKTFAELLHTHQDIAESMGLPRFLDVISDKGVDMNTQSTTKLQLATVSLEMAVAYMLKTWGVIPDVVIGHSLGEYAALNAAGVLSVSDVLYLVGSRAMLMEKHLVHDTHAMLATSTNAQGLRSVLKKLELDSCGIACINAASETVASGLIEDIRKLKSHLTDSGERATLLRIPYGFHSAQIAPILDEFQDLARGVVFSKPEVPIISTLTGKLAQADEFSPEYLGRQARESVNFVGALRACKDAGFANENALFIEVGPDPVCLGLTTRTLELAPSARLLPTLKSGQDNWGTISVVLKAAYETGVSVNWCEFHKNFKNSVKLLDLPRYAFDNKNFWTSYVEPAAMTPTSKSGSSGITAPKLSGFPSTSIHRVESEVVQDSGITVTFASEVSDSNLLRTIRGHVVNGHEIFPLGVLGDMALTASRYAYFKIHGTEMETEMMSIHNINMTKAIFLIDGGVTQTVCVTGTYTTKKDIVDITFHSRNGDQESTNGTCRIEFGDSKSWREAQSQTLFLLKSRMEMLEEQVALGKAHRLFKPIVYRLFSDAVAYSEPYRGLEEVILDSDCRDAIGRIKLQNTQGLGSFLVNPYDSDAVTHLPGFMLNCGIKYSEDIACLSLGFDSWRSLEPLSHEKTYTCYVSMQEAAGSPIISGSCYLFDGHKLIQATSNMKFQKLKKIALDHVLGVPTATATRRALPSHEHGDNCLPNSTKPSKTVQSNALGETYTPNSQLSSGTEMPTPFSGYSTAATEYSRDDDVFATFLSIVANESGCSPDDTTDEATFADLGVDSLMAITVFANLKRETGVDLEASFFIENHTIGEARQALLVRTGGSQQKPLSQETPAESIMAIPAVVQEVSLTPPTKMTNLVASRAADMAVEENKQGPAPAAHYSCKLTHLQGNPTPDSSRIYLIADETGSALSYIQLPTAGPGLCVYGVDAPSSKEGTPHDLSITELAGVFADSIRREQPSGPYLLGGISAGAIIAYEVAQHLLAAGEQVQGLLLLDPSEAKEVQKRISTLGEGSAVKPAQRQRMQRTLTALESYTAAPLVGGSMKTALIVSRETADAETTWNKLVPAIVRSCKIDASSGSLMRFPVLNSFGKMYKDAIASIRE